MAAVTDRDFLAGLRAVAESTADALGDRASLARDANNYQAAEVADLAANGFRALAELASTRLDAERARLATAVRDAETAASAADADFGTWDHAAMRAADRLFLTPGDRARVIARMQAAETAAEEAHRAVEAARAALADFDRNGGAE